MFSPPAADLCGMSYPAQSGSISLSLSHAHTHIHRAGFIRLTEHLMGIACLSMHAVCPLIPRGLSEPAAAAAAALRTECEHCFASPTLCSQLII